MFANMAILQIEFIYVPTVRTVKMQHIIFIARNFIYGISNHA